MEIFDYVILGAGLGGLSAAACLTRQGYRVAVLEQHYLPGGCCHTFDYGDYRFCADVHYIYQCGPNQTVSQFLDYIGREVTFNSLDPDCIDRVITPDVDFAIPLDWEKFRQRLLAEFPEESGPINTYCDEIKRLHDEVRQLGQEVRWYDQKWTDWLKLPKYWNLFQKRTWTLQDLYDHAGLSPKHAGPAGGSERRLCPAPQRNCAADPHRSGLGLFRRGLLSQIPLQGLLWIPSWTPSLKAAAPSDTLTPVEHIEVVDGDVKMGHSGRHRLRSHPHLHQ